MFLKTESSSEVKGLLRKTTRDEAVKLGQRHIVNDLYVISREASKDFEAKI